MEYILLITLSMEMIGEILITWTTIEAMYIDIYDIYLCYPFNH